MTYEEFEQKLVGANSREKAYGLAVAYLKDRPRFDWTGVYAVEGNELVLRSFIGRPTEQMRLPLGKGVCGQALSQRADQRIDDVAKAAGYVAHNLDVKAQLAVLIKTGETIYGVIDAESHTRSGFADADLEEVKKVAAVVARYFALHRDLPERAPPKSGAIAGDGAGRLFYMRCSVCKKEIAWGQTWYKCTVSTCNRNRLALTFCSTACWDSHLPEARHREAGFTEHRAPSKPSFR